MVPVTHASEDRGVVARRRLFLVAQSWSIGVVGVILAVPLVAACAWLFGNRWAPIYDIALIEMRVRDVGTRYTPLLGLGGRLGRWPEIGCHPGPLAFYVLWPFYRIFGRSYWALRASTSISVATAMFVALFIARRRTGAFGVVVVGAVFAVIELGFGLLTLTEPWNPYFPVIWFVTFLVAIWSVFAGDVKILPAAAAIASLCAQTHISYLPVCSGLLALGTLLAVGTWAKRARDGLERRHAARACIGTVVVTVVLWIPPIIEQWIHERGNFEILWEYFRKPPEASVGFRMGTELVLLRLDVWAFFSQSLDQPGLFRQAYGGDPSTSRGALMLAAWLLSAALAQKLRDRTTIALTATVAAALALGFVSASRIIGFPFAHVLFFEWSIGVLVLLSTLWNAGCLLRSHGFASPRGRRLASILAVGLILTCVGRLSARPELSAPRPPAASLQVAAMAPDTAAALRRGVAGTDGAVGPYVVSWEDALFGGGQGIGLLVELERRGIRAYLPASPFNSSIVGPHRVTDPNGAKARIHVVNGAWVEETRNTLGAVQVAYSDPRTAAERAESEIAIGRLAQALRRIGRPDLVPLIEHRLTSIDSPKLTPWDKLVIGHVSDLGMPAAVFIMPK